MRTLKPHTKSKPTMTSILQAYHKVKCRVFKTFKTRRSQSRMPVLSRDQEEDVPNARDGKFPRFFGEKTGSREMAFGNADLYIIFIIFLYFHAEGKITALSFKNLSCCSRVLITGL